LEGRPIEEVTIPRAAMTLRPAAQWALSVSATGCMERSHQQRAQREKTEPGRIHKFKIKRWIKIARALLL
jgi:hypothetical protein